MRSIILMVIMPLFLINTALAEWVDVDGVGQESINASNTGWALGGAEPVLCLDSLDNPHIAWHDMTTGNSEVYYLEWDGASWVDADGVGQDGINVSNNTGISFPIGLDLCLDNSDNPHITWPDNTSGNSDIYYLYWGGSNWVDADGSGQESVDIYSAPNESRWPSMQLDNLDNPHIAWHDYSVGPDSFYLKWDGSAWVDADGTGQESVNVSDFLALNAEPTSLCLDNSQNPHKTWYHITSPIEELHYLKWNGNSWTDIDGIGRESIVVHDVTEMDQGEPWAPRLCLDSLDYPHIIWGDDPSGTNTEIYYLKWNGTTWVDADGSGQESINISNTSKASGRARLVLDNSGNPHVAWEEVEGTDREIYYIRWNGTTWVDADGVGLESINVSNDGANSRYPSLSLDNSDNPHIAWAWNALSVPNDIYYLYWIPDGTTTPTTTTTPTGTITPTLTASTTASPSHTTSSTPTTTPTITLTPSRTHTVMSVTSTVTPTITATRTRTPTFTFTMTPEAQEIVVYPNPFNPDKAVGGKLKIKGLPEDAKISIYTVSGELVGELVEEGGSAYWDGRTKDGGMVSMGSYVYVIRVGKETLKRGKVVVVR